MPHGSNNPETPSQPAQAEPVPPSGVRCQHEEHFIGQYEKAPEFMKDNLSITGGYRINFNTPSRILRSLFMLHNESVNIWTHCLPALFLLCLILSFVVVVDGPASFQQHRRDIEDNLHAFHQKLRNISFSEEAEHEVKAIKVSVLQGYQELLDGIESKSLQMRQLLEGNLQDFRDSLAADLIDRLHAFEKSKRKFQQEIAPRVVEQFQQTFHGSFVAIREHLEELREHLDSSAFLAMELHGERPNPQHVSKWPVFVFLLSAAICLLNSTVFHLFHPMSSKAYGVLLRFDFAGISLLIAGTAFPCFYYGMYCQMAVATLYLSWTFAAAVGCFVICLFEWIHRPGNEKYRSVVFGSFAFSMAVPMSHMVVNELLFDNHGDPYRFSSAGLYYALLISCYICGLYVFTVRCPERNNPGRYNLCGHSHQIWHVMVVLGVVFSYFGVMENFEMRKASACPA